jgi:hypothetical protein
MVMRHANDRPAGPERVYTALQERCPDCDRVLGIYQVDGRRVQSLDAWFWLKRRDKRCVPGCPGTRTIFYAPRDLRVVLPKRIYGLDVTMQVGERHILDGLPLARITRDLNARGLPIDQRHTGRVFRDFLALTQLARGDEGALRARLVAQGGIVLMCDGVQFDDRSPVLYLVWDAISGEPLFGERKPYRGEDDLVPLLKRVRAMNVPVIGVVTDKEKGLVPAVTQVFPGTPYQYCQTHFLTNCAKPMASDLCALQASVRRRADAVREVAKFIEPSEQPQKRRAPAPPEPLGETGPTRPTPQAPSTAPGPGSVEAPSREATREVELAREVCELVRVNSRLSGKAPLDPPELKRHERLEKVRGLVNEAREKKRQRGRQKRMAPA